MKEFLFFIMSEGKPLANASPEEMQQHIRKVGDYIRKNVKEGKFLGAQPLESNGVTIGGSKGNIFDGPYIESKEVISGYYHVLAKDMEEAVEIAKSDPRFDEENWSIVIRPIQKLEGINKD
jgi:hypothetical protein